MPSEAKTFRVTCAECGKDFTVRFTVIDDRAEGVGEEAVTCMYCDQQVIIPLEKKYQKPGELVRTLKVDK